MLATIKFLPVKTTGGFNFLLHLIIHILPIFYNELFFFLMRKRLLSWKTAWSACLFSRVTKKGVAREMQLHRALVRRKPQGASGCWEPERGKKDRLGAGCFGKVQAMQEQGWQETTQELPGTAVGLPGSHRSFLVSLPDIAKSLYCSNSCHCNATQMGSPLPACWCPTQHHLAKGNLLWWTLRTWDGPFSQMHTTLHLTLTSSTSQPRHSSTWPQRQQFLPPSSAFCILFPGLENMLPSSYIPSDLHSSFVIKPSTEHSEYSGNQPWIFTGRTDAQAEAPILFPLIAKNWLTGKEFDVGKDRRQEEKGTTEDETVG